MTEQELQQAQDEIMAEVATEDEDEIEEVHLNLCTEEDIQKAINQVEALTKQLKRQRRQCQASRQSPEGTSRIHDGHV